MCIRNNDINYFSSLPLILREKCWRVLSKDFFHFDIRIEAKNKLPNHIFLWLYLIKSGYLIKTITVMVKNLADMIKSVPRV